MYTSVCPPSPPLVPPSRVGVGGGLRGSSAKYPGTRAWENITIITCSFPARPGCASASLPEHTAGKSDGALPLARSRNPACSHPPCPREARGRRAVCAPLGTAQLGPGCGGSRALSPQHRPHLCLRKPGKFIISPTGFSSETQINFPFLPFSQASQSLNARES